MRRTMIPFFALALAIAPAASAFDSLNLDPGQAPPDLRQLFEAPPGDPPPAEATEPPVDEAEPPPPQADVRDGDAPGPDAEISADASDPA